MADPISISSGVVALVTFGLQASVILYQTITSIKGHTKNVRDLRQDLLTLQNALRELQEVVTGDTAANFSSLELPLHSCATACCEFEAQVRKWTARTDDSHRSIRDWAKLHFASNEISAFRNTLSGYKSTIQIALGGMNLRTSIVTRECVLQYQELIRDTKADLQEQLQQIENRLWNAAAQETLPEEANERRRMQEERDSTIRCLSICDEVAEYINSREAAVNEGVSEFTSDSADATPGKVTISTLAECREKLNKTRTELAGRLDAAQSGFAMLSRATQSSEERNVRECLALCDEFLGEAGRVRTNLYEEISIADHGQQYIVSTIGDLISAKRVTAGVRSVQVMGQMSDESFQQSLSHLSASIATSDPPSVATVEDRRFLNYGAGRSLSNLNTASQSRSQD